MMAHDFKAKILTLSTHNEMGEILKGFTLHYLIVKPALLYNCPLKKPKQSSWGLILLLLLSLTHFKNLFKENWEGE